MDGSVSIGIPYPCAKSIKTTSCWSLPPRVDDPRTSAGALVSFCVAGRAALHSEAHGDRRTCHYPDNYRGVGGLQPGGLQLPVSWR